MQAVIDDCKQPHSAVVFDRPKTESSSDPFSSLSAKLRLMILELLGMKDVANLRLASSAFRQLPQSYFRHLIPVEMPWVWEVSALGVQARGIDWYKLWLALRSADGADLNDEKERLWLGKVRGEAYMRLQKEQEERGLKCGTEEYQKPFRERGPNYDEQCEREIREGYASGKWPGKKATEASGLRNRRRVWTDVEEILRRIEVKNERGDREKLGSPKE